ncbi:MAG TPA: 50S ribosomal protein L21 [Pirellulales bacterium]|jgi:large subunit ribosomal protein L21|nr:50S ribosomal protein L21 [Pirellulales bacterium]
MYAIILDGRRQLKVEEGAEIVVDLRDGLKTGDAVKFDRILAVSGDQGLKLGTPALDGASVTAEVVGLVQGPKLVVQHFRRRKNSRRRNGHRQVSTRVRINKISI